MNIDKERAQQDDLGPRNRTWGIFLISVLGLFLEMLLIRWVGTEIRIFAYLQNTVLVVCFLGLGLGCFTCRQPIVIREALIPLGVLVLLLAIPQSREALGSISTLLSVLNDMLIWSNYTSDSTVETVLFVMLGLVLTYLVLVLVLDTFVPIGRLLGRLMDDHRSTITAYSANVAGSLVGTWLFVAVSFFSLPPLVWFAVFAVLAFVFLDRTRSTWRTSTALLVGIVALAWPAGWVPEALTAEWSPYQKLVLREARPENNEPGDYTVTVNNAGHQTIIDLRESRVRSDPDHYPPEMNGLSQYDIPLLLHPDPQSLLVVGAGTGNDVAGGLRHSVREITAVEIDPSIITMGQAFHPEKPYDSAVVEVVNDDARSFFSTTEKKYDVISFGLLDSHTTSAMTNARLDHYVYTQESITRAKSLLSDNGIMVLTFWVQKPYIADRIATVLRDAFGDEPISFLIPYSNYGGGGVMFIAGDLAAARAQIAKNAGLAALIGSAQRNHPVPISFTTRVATDDWPYLYLERPSIPVLYYLLVGLMLVILVRSYRRWQARGLVARWSGSHWHFFFLGAAFLLLEVQSISKASVVLGNTWQVNAVIVSGVLSMILLANLLARRFPGLPTGAAYLALIGICVCLYFIDLAQFAFLPYVTRAAVIGGLTTLPMLFSGIIFIRSFAAVDGKNEALGANLIGSVIGALIQSVTFIVGIKALLLIVATSYCLSLVTRPAAVEVAPQRQPGPALEV